MKAPDVWHKMSGLPSCCATPYPKTAEFSNSLPGGHVFGWELAVLRGASSARRAQTAMYHALKNACLGRDVARYAVGEPNLAAEKASVRGNWVGMWWVVSWSGLDFSTWKVMFTQACRHGEVRCAWRLTDQLPIVYKYRYHAQHNVFGYTVYRNIVEAWMTRANVGALRRFERRESAVMDDICDELFDDGRGAMTQSGDPRVLRWFARVYNKHNWPPMPRSWVEKWVTWACANGYAVIIEFLITDPLLKQHAVPALRREVSQNTCGGVIARLLRSVSEQR